MQWDEATAKQRHRPPHWMGEGKPLFVTAATTSRLPHLLIPERRDWFVELLHDLAWEIRLDLVAWVVLKEHYHILIRPEQQAEAGLMRWLGRLHWVSSCQWNSEDGATSRQVWHEYWDSNLWTDGDFWSRINYIHRNPVKHGYVEDAFDYPWSSLRQLTEAWDHPAPLKGLSAFPAPRKLPNDDY